MSVGYVTVLSNRGYVTSRSADACCVEETTREMLSLFHLVAAEARTSQPAPPLGYVPIPELSDEFEGATLDASKWSTSVGWVGRKPGLFDPQNVVVSDGKLQLWARQARRNDSWPEGFDNFTTAAVHSVARVREGLFEVRWRSGSSGISSSWWFHQSTVADGWTEIDVFETTGVANGKLNNASQLPSHVHIFKLPNMTIDQMPANCGGCELQPKSDPKHCTLGSLYSLPKRAPTWADDFHVARLNWTDAGVTISIDGEVVNRIASPCLIQEIGMDFDRETMPGWMRLPDPASLPDRPFEIDYVRAWRREKRP
jgi:beta-glucanase (GH16 family)